MKNYKLTLVGLAISVIVLLCVIIFDLDLFENSIKFIKELELFEVDEFIIPIFIFGCFAFLDFLKKKRTAQIEIEKIKIYKAMMFSTQHILNNFLNKMQLFQITAKESPNFDPDILDLYDQVIEEADIQINALSKITNINESSIYDTVIPNTKRH